MLLTLKWKPFVWYNACKDKVKNQKPDTTCKDKVEKPKISHGFKATGWLMALYNNKYNIINFMVNMNAFRHEGYRFESYFKY